MAEAGFKATYNPADGSTEYGAGAQSEIAAERFNECIDLSVESGVVAAPVEPDRALLTEWYGFWLQTQECLVDNGYPTSEPPSLEAYIESGGIWHPYDTLMEQLITAEEFARLEETCPQNHG